MAEDDRFRQEYARQLASALRQAEENPIERTDDDLLQETLRQLSLDHPRGWTSRGCALLSRALADPSSPYVLSNELVEGLGQALARVESASGVEEQQSDDNDLRLIATNEASIASALANLASTVHVRLPLEVCLTSDFSTAVRLLGRYRVEVETEDHDHNELNDAARGQDEPVEPAPPVAIGNGHAPEPIDDLAEVWAVESDPSDFAFESDRNVEQELRELEEWATLIESRALAMDESAWQELLASATWKDLAAALTSLLRLANYTKLSVVADWQGLARSLLQLSLILLLPGESSDTPLLTTYPPSHWQKLALHSIHILRDATSQRPALLETYLELLQSMIRVPSTIQSSESTPALLMGCGLLSNLCHVTLEERREAIPKVRRTVLESCDDWTDLLAKTKTSSAADAVPWTFLPLATIMAKGLTNAEAQVLLNSGLVREWIVWLERLEGEVGQEVARSLLDWSLVSPKLIGKYIWRYPNLASRLTGDVASTDALLWNTIGMELADASRTMVQWKKTSNLRPVPTSDECQASVIALFTTLCKETASVVERWRQQREEGAPLPESQETKGVVEFAQMVDRISTPLISTLFSKAMEQAKSSEASFSAQDSLDKIKDLLTGWPATPPQVHDNKAKTDEDDEQEANATTDAAPLPSKERLLRRAQDDAVNSLRRAIKVLQLMLEAKDTRQSFSSKAD